MNIRYLLYRCGLTSEYISKDKKFKYVRNKKLELFTLVVSILIPGLIANRLFLEVDDRLLYQWTATFLMYIVIIFCLKGNKENL